MACAKRSTAGRSISNSFEGSLRGSPKWQAALIGLETQLEREFRQALTPEHMVRFR